MKYVILLLIGLLFSPSAYCATNVKTINYKGECHNSFFIKKDSDILTTMNLLITSKDISQNNFSCDNMTFTSINDNYHLSINISYRNIPYIISFTGKQSDSNNGIVFIPSGASIVNLKEDLTIMSFNEDSLLGACTISNKLNTDRVMCLVAMKNNADTFAVKINLK
mgnify:CR=1 FL=1